MISDLIVWLSARDAAGPAFAAIEAFTVSTRTSFKGLPTADVEKARLMFSEHTLVGTVMLELGKQLVAGEPMDRGGLRLLARFLERNPEAMGYLRKHQPADPEQAELFNTLLARAQGEGTGRHELEVN